MVGQTKGRQIKLQCNKMVMDHPDVESMSELVTLMNCHEGGGGGGGGGARGV